MTDLYGAGGDFEDKRADTAFVHQTSCLDSPCQVGERTQIFHFSHVMGHTIIGDDCVIGQHVTIGSGVLMGNAVRVMNNALLVSGVILENQVYCGPGTTFAPITRVRGRHQGISQVTRTLVKRGATLGPHTTVSTGFTMGEFCFVEAGSVVDRHVPAYAIVSGDPIRFKAWRCQCGQELVFQHDRATCPQCRKRYDQVDTYRVALHVDEDGGYGSTEYPQWGGIRP